MKNKKLFLILIPFISLGLVSCNNSVSTYEETPNITVNNEQASDGEISVYLALTVNGLYNGNKGQDSDELFLENYVVFSGTAGTSLPDSDVITSTQEDVVFTSWIKYDGDGVPNVVTELSSDIDGDILYAFFSYEGDYDFENTSSSEDFEIVRIYFEDASWWSTDGAYTSIYLWTSSGAQYSTWPGTLMSKVSGEDDIWYFDVDVSTYSYMIFVRTSSLGADWGAKTVDITISDRGENNLYSIANTSASWGDPGITGVWSTYTE